MSSDLNRSSMARPLYRFRNAVAVRPVAIRTERPSDCGLEASSRFAIEARLNAGDSARCARWMSRALTRYRFGLGRQARKNRHVMVLGRVPRLRASARMLQMPEVNTVRRNETTAPVGLAPVDSLSLWPGMTSLRTVVSADRMNASARGATANVLRK